MNTDRDRLAADLATNTPIGAQNVSDWRPTADRLIALGWTRLDFAPALRPGRAAMTTDRIAALAEALHDLYAGKDATFDSDQCRHSEDATAILDALPSDWCGHEDRHYVPAGITLPGKSREDYIDEANEAIRVLTDDRERDRVEIARLRKIEEAARALADAVRAFATRTGHGFADRELTAFDRERFVMETAQLKAGMRSPGEESDNWPKAYREDTDA